MLTKTTVRRCGIKFRIQCPISWERLATTSDQRVRSCGSCNHLVYFCDTDEETLEHARAGHCIARLEPHETELPAITIGLPDAAALSTSAEEPQAAAEGKRALAWRGRERGIADALALDLTKPVRSCPECHYPVPSWRVTCYVCNYEIGRAETREG